MAGLIIRSPTDAPCKICFVRARQPRPHQPFHGIQAYPTSQAETCGSGASRHCEPLGHLRHLPRRPLVLDAAPPDLPGHRGGNVGPLGFLPATPVHQWGVASTTIWISRSHGRTTHGPHGDSQPPRFLTTRERAEARVAASLVRKNIPIRVAYRERCESSRPRQRAFRVPC